MLKRLLKSLCLFGVIVAIFALVLEFTPLVMYMMVAFLFGTVGGATENGRLTYQLGRMFYFILLLIIYCGVGWEVDPAIVAGQFIVPIKSWAWVRWVGVGTLVATFCLLGGLKPGYHEEKRARRLERLRARQVCEQQVGAGH